MTDAHLTLDEADALCLDVLKKSGCSEDHARAIADTIMAAETDGCSETGLFWLPAYATALRNRSVDGYSAPEYERIAPGVVRIDGKGGFAPLALRRGRDPLCALAKEQGIAALSVTNVVHMAALWLDVEPIAARGFVAFAWTAAGPMVAPTGGTVALFGTNPMCFGWPRRHGPPLVFDQASSTTTRAEVMAHARDGKSMPFGVGIDIHGNNTSDPTEILQGAQLPFGGHKGSAIAMMIELLAGALIGQAFSFETGVDDFRDGAPPLGGELMLAIDPAHFGDPGGWQDRGERLFSKIIDQKGTRLPGTRRYENRDRTRSEGIRIPKKLYDEILALGH